MAKQASTTKKGLKNKVVCRLLQHAYAKVPLKNIHKIHFFERSRAHSERRRRTSDGACVSPQVWTGSRSMHEREQDLARVAIAWFLGCHVFSSPVLLLLLLKALMQGIRLSSPVSILVEYSSIDERIGIRFGRILWNSCSMMSLHYLQ